MAYTMTFTFSLGSAKAGLTLRGQLLDVAGEAVGSAITGFVEVGTGIYMLTASVPAAHRGALKVYENGVAGTILAAAPVNPEEGEYVDAAMTSRLDDADTRLDAIATIAEGVAALPSAEEIDDELTAQHGTGAWNPAAVKDWTDDEREQIRDALGVDGTKTDATGGALAATLASILAKANLIGSAGVEFDGSVNSDGTMDLVAGDDYLVSNGKEFIWTVESWAGPDLSGATGSLAFVTTDNYEAGIVTAVLTATMTLTMDGADAVFTAELTAAQSVLLEASPPDQHYNYVYQVRIVTAAAKKMTIRTDAVHVEPGT